MHNSAYKLLKHIKNAAAMGSGSFMPPEPLPNSVKANQIEQQELAEQQGAASAGAGNEQMMQMQKAQEDAVNELQQTKQQLAQMQGELQNVQAQSQQQQQAMQMNAQQEIQKAQMDAQYELQSEKIKNQQKLLSVQEKAMRTAGKAKPDQNHILSNQLKRVVRKVNSLKSASVQPVDAATQKKDSAAMAAEKKYRGLPYADVAPSQRTQQQWNDISTWKRNRIATDPKFKAIQEKANAAPVKGLGAGDFVKDLGGSMKDYLDNPWQETETFKDNAFGAYDEDKGMLGNLASNPIGSAGRLATNLFTGYVPNLVGGSVEAAKGVYNLDPMRAAKGVGTAGLGLLEGAVTIGTMGAGGAITKALQAPGRALASGAQKYLSPALAKPFQSSITKGIANIGTQIPLLGGVYYGADKLGLGNPNMSSSGTDADGAAQESDYQDMNTEQSPNQPVIGGSSFPGGFYAPQPQQQQRWDAGLSPSERFSVMNQAQAMNKSGTDVKPLGATAKQVEYPDIRKFMKNPPPPGEEIASPIPILQAGFGQPKFNMPQVKQQGYGPLGDFIKQLIFQVGFPMFGMRNPLHPDFSKVHGSLVNNEAYKVQPPNTFY